MCIGQLKFPWSFSHTTFELHSSKNTFLYSFEHYRSQKAELTLVVAY